MYPEVVRFRRTDFHLAAEIAQAGYDCARMHLTEHAGKFQRTSGTVSPTRAVSATDQRPLEPAFQSTATRLV